MVSPGSTGLLGAFEQAARTGDPSGLAGAYAPDAGLEARLAGGPIHRHGPDAIVDTLGTWWNEPSRLPVWQAQITPDGFILVTERSSGDEKLRRQRHWVHVRDQLVVRHLVFSDRPRHGLALPDPCDEPSLLHRAVRRAPLPHLGKSGNLIERAELDDGRTLIVKHVSPAWGWLTRVTSDPGREAKLWRDGVLGRLSWIDPAIVHVEEAADGSRIFMRDVSDALFPAGGKLRPGTARTIMQALAAVHRACFGESMPYLSTVEDHMTFNSPRISALEGQGIDALPKVVEAGDDRLDRFLPTDLAATVRRLSDDPSGLADRLRRFGTTLLHGDPKLDNLGLRDGKPIIIDWGLATAGPPAVDMAWMLSRFVDDIDAPPDAMMAWFRELWGDLFDEEELALGLVGEFVNAVWFMALFAAEHPDPDVRASSERELETWVPRVRHALDRHAPM
jgi:Phosphotransferase enzyme family